MTENYVTVFSDNTAVYSEKHSDFFANIRHCENEEEFFSFLSEIKKKYFDARHHVFAYKFKNNGSIRFSDDGEPHGTAGKPVLDVLNGSAITDVAIIVSRKFGGILLGTGGLVHAYSSAAKMCIDSAEKCTMAQCRRFVTVCDYQKYELFEKLIADCGGTVIDKVFTDTVTVTYSVKDENADIFVLKLTETFSGKLKCEEIGSFFTISEKFY